MFFNDSKAVENALKACRILNSKELSSLMEFDITSDIQASTERVIEASIRLNEHSAIATESLSSLLPRLQALDKDTGSAMSVLERCNVLTELRASCAALTAAIDSFNWEEAAAAASKLRKEIENESQQEKMLSKLGDQDFLLLLGPISQLKGMAMLRKHSYNASRTLEVGCATIKNALCSILGVSEVGVGDYPKIQQVNVLRCFRLFPKIGEHQLGLEIYARYIVSQLEMKSKEAFESLVECSDESSFPQFLKRLFENIATLIDNSSSSIISIYGNEKNPVLYFIKQLNSVAVSQSALLFDSWLEKRRIRSLLALTHKQQDKNSSMGAREIDVILYEFASILRCSFFYERFIRTRIEENTFNSEKMLEKNITPNQINLVSLSDRNLNGFYSDLECYYFRSSIKHAVSIDSNINNSGILQNDDQSTGSLSITAPSQLIDDVFYLLKKVYYRVLSTCNLELSCMIFHEFERDLAIEVLDPLHASINMYLKMFRENLRPESRRLMMRNINSLSQAVLYMSKFLSEIEVKIKSVFQEVQIASGSSYNEKENNNSISKITSAISSCLASLNKLSHAKSHAVTGFLKTIFTTFVSGKLSSLLTNLHTNYAMSEQEYLLTVDDNTGLFLAKNQKFVNGIMSLLGSTKSEMAPSNLKIFLLIFIENMVQEWERIVYRQSFSQPGALFLERDIRFLMQFFQELGTESTVERNKSQMIDEQYEKNSEFSINSSKSTDLENFHVSFNHELRERFAILLQITVILKIVTVDEIFDYWGHNSITNITWKLDAASIRTVLSLRKDFSIEQIRSLEL